MAWDVELEPEVEDWLRSLTPQHQGRVAFYLDLLAEKGVLLDFPYTSQLRGKLRELRFHLGRDQQRISYYIASGRRIPMLTVFRKTKRREKAEIDRAEAAMRAHHGEGQEATMTTKWKDLRRDLLATPEAKAAYGRARRDYELGLQVRQLREAAGISQTELAQRMGTSQPAVARLEAGGGSPKLDTLERAAAALGAELTVQFVAASPKLRAVGAAAKPARRSTKASAAAGAAKQQATARVTKTAAAKPTKMSAAPRKKAGPRI